MEEDKNSQKKETSTSEKNEKSDIKKSSSTTEESKKEIINSNKNDKEMEVHVKPQENKEFKVKLFLYEFFIIFLAVSLSFIVENIRESYIDHHKERQYIKSLVNDIKIDTTQLNSVIKFNQEQFKGIDTLLRIIENPNTKNLTNNIYFYSMRYLNTFSNFTHTDRTITQLKNAGGLRLIRNKAVSDSIVTYDALVHDVEFNSDFCFKTFYDLSKQQKKLLDFKIYRKEGVHSLIKLSNLKLLDNDPKKIDYYYNETLYFGYLIAGYKIKLVELKQHANQLLKTLKSEYDIE